MVEGFAVMKPQRQREIMETTGGGGTILLAVHVLLLCLICGDKLLYRNAGFCKQLQQRFKPSTTRRLVDWQRVTDVRFFHYIYFILYYLIHYVTFYNFKSKCWILPIKTNNVF